MSAICGETLVFGQQEGPDLELRVFGDEFYARYETKDGYTVVFDMDRGLYCYAMLQGGEFVSSGTPCSKGAPTGTPRHLREDRQVRNDKFGQRYANLRPPERPLGSNVMRTMGPNNGLLTGRQVNHGNVRGLTILVEFEDVRTSISREEVEAMLNEESYSAHGNFCSVRKYYKLMSAGKLDYTNVVVGPVRLSRKQSHYINDLLVKEALEIALRDFDVRLEDFDSRGQGVVDALSFLYAGRTLYAGDLWPHNSVIGLRAGNMRTHFYTIQSLGRRTVDLSIGTFAHESGHMLCRFPDVYDYGQRDGDFEASSGLGRFCLMSSGNHLNGGKTPSAVCAYLRDLVGWCDQEIDLNNPGAFEALHGDYRKVLRYATQKPNEYFLVENRSMRDLDRFLPASGLAVYHCDTRGSNEFQDGTPDNHYQVALLQADGRQDLERNVNGGDGQDLFGRVDGSAVDAETVPHTREWSGSDSGLALSEISAPDTAISFKVGTQEAQGNVIEEAVTADLIIPDSNEQGVRSPLAIAASGTLAAIRVGVEITHTYRGDLNVQLVAPSGKKVLLHGDQGGQLDNLSLDLESRSFAPLRDLEGEQIAGDWHLEVRDLLADDVGRLDTWGVTLEYEGSDQIARQEVSPSLPIPDTNTQGVRSELAFNGVGAVKDLTVEVEIGHTYRGDLQIELSAPSGERALLRARDGDSRPDVRTTFTSATSPALVALFGEAANGTWTLHVRDLAPADTGRLERWALAIRH